MSLLSKPFDGYFMIFIGHTRTLLYRRHVLLLYQNDIDIQHIRLPPSITTQWMYFSLLWSQADLLPKLILTSQLEP